MATPAAPEANPHHLDAVLDALVQELGTLIPYVAVLREHLAGAVQATATGVTEVIGRIDRVHGLSNVQVERIQQSLQQCLVLVDVTRQQGTHSGRVVALVRAVIAAKEITAKIGHISERMTAELALAETSAQTVRGSADQLQQATGEMKLMEARYGSASVELQGMLGSIQSSNGEVVTQLTEALGHLQFQDILRQRVGQVEAALQDLGEHAEDLVDKVATGTWDGGLESTLQDRMDRHLATYVMANQRTTHAHAVGLGPANSSDGPAIELF